MSNRAHNYLRLAAEAIQNDQAVTVQETVPVMMSDQEDELQLHEEEGTPKSSRKKRNYDGATKLEAVKWARDKKSSRSGNANIISAAKKFKVTRSRIQERVKQEAVIKQQVNSPGGSKRKRLEGGGRNVSFPELDAQLAVWIREKRELKQPELKQSPTKRMNFSISIGWLDKFLKRNNFVLRRVTTTAQKPPENYAEVIAKFVVHVEQLRKKNNFSQVIAMDETAVWFDCPDGTCIETKGAKDVTVVTTGHEKMRITVCLAADSTGRKLLPYVLVNRKRPVSKVEEEFKGRLLICWNGSVWMDDNTTEEFLRRVIKAGGVFSGKRLLVWDAFATHKSVRTIAVLKELGVEAAFIPGGCTKFIQAPDVSWNKPFKGHIRDYYNTWMTNYAHKEFTKGGNPKPPALEVVLSWIYRAWQEISKEVIIKSFKACAITTATDGSDDNKITCFKPEGSIGVRGLDILREVQAQQKAQDGRHDFEEAGIEEGELVEFEYFNEDEFLLFDD